MRISGQMLRKQSDIPDDFLHLLHAVCLVFEEAEVVKSPRDDIIDRCTLIQGRGRILEHHLDIPDDLAVERMRNLAGNRNSLVKNPPRRAGVDADDRAPDGGFSGAGLADQGEGLPFVDVK